MGLRIRTNVASLNAQRQLAKTTTGIQESSAKLSSGKRINKAADDAAGLAISSNLNADVRSLQQAKRNANDGVSLVQTAEGVISTVTQYELGIGVTSKNQKFIQEILAPLPILPFDSDCAETAIRIYHELKSKNKLILPLDIYIGATAITHNLPIATLNRKHFERIENLTLY